MGRIPKIRVNYQADATFLMNLSRAIEADDKRDPEWKRVAIEHITSLVTLFLRDASEQIKSRSAK